MTSLNLARIETQNEVVSCVVCRDAERRAGPRAAGGLEEEHRPRREHNVHILLLLVLHSVPRRRAALQGRRARRRDGRDRDQEIRPLEIWFRSTALLLQSFEFIAFILLLYSSSAFFHVPNFTLLIIRSFLDEIQHSIAIIRFPNLFYSLILYYLPE